MEIKIGERLDLMDKKTKKEIPVILDRIDREMLIFKREDNEQLVYMMCKPSPWDSEKKDFHLIYGV